MLETKMKNKIVYLMLGIFLLSPTALAFSLIEINTTVANISVVNATLFPRTHWVQTLDDILHPRRLDNSVAIGLNTTEAKFEVNGTTYLGDITQGLPDSRTPVNVLELRSLWNPGLKFAPQEDPTAYAEMWYDNSVHELHFNVTDGYYMHKFIFDGHGAFIADSIKSNGLTLSSRYTALDEGTVSEPTFRLWDTGIYFPNTTNMGFVTNGVEQMLLDDNGNLQIDGNLNVDGNLMVSGCICYDYGAECLGDCI